MNLTTVERVMKRINPAKGGEAQGAHLHFLGDAIASVSAAVERYMDRAVQVATVTEYFDVECGQCVFRLRAYPVTSVTGAWFDTNQGFGSVGALSSSIDYYLPTLRSDGIFEFQFPRAIARRAPASLKITYVGGMAPDTAEFIETYPDIADAVDKQLVFEFHRRNDLGAATVTSDGGTVTFPAVTWLPEMRKTLDQHRRRNAG